MSETWYLNPLKWVDEFDLFDLDGSLNKQRAIDILKDKHVSRPSDDSVMARGIFNSTYAAGLTRKQQSAVDLAREAMVAGQTATVYVAEQLGINRHSAYKLLQRADARLPQPKMETSGLNFDRISNARSRISEQAIQRVIAGMKVECAGCGERPAPARTALCHECIRQYGIEGERPERTVAWLDPMIRLARQEARKRAIDKLMVVDYELAGD